MRFIFNVPIVVLLLFVETHVSGQNLPGQLLIDGFVVNEQTDQSLPFVQVALFEPNADQPVSFTETNDSGKFSMRAPAGNYVLRFFLLGHESTEIKISLFENIGVGKIKMAEENQNLAEVVVTTNKFPMRADVEGLTINPNQNLSNLGGTLLDILRNTPSVNVSDDGSISLRGSSGTNILI